jgi:hypothetical protein
MRVKLKLATSLDAIEWFRALAGRRRPAGYGRACLEGLGLRPKVPAHRRPGQCAREMILLATRERPAALDGYSLKIVGWRSVTGEA